MGDYGFGVLVQNNTGNKSAFPVRIHPHLQPPHHHQNATPSPAAFINSTAAGNGSNGSSPWLFPAAAAHSNMQDEILGSEKPKAQQQELQETQEKQQQLSPGHQEGGIISELEKVRSEESKVESGASEGANGKEKLRLESPVLTAFDYQEPSGLGTAVQSSTSSSLTSFNNWSAAIPPTPSTIINEDISFFNPASANNGPLLFQNFSHHVSPGFGGNFSPQIGPISQHHPPHPHFQHPHNQHQQHRRSPASPHPPPFPHRNAAFGQLPHLSNNLSKPPSPWGSYQSPSPSPSSTSWSPGGGYGSWGGSRGGEFRRGLNGGMTPLNSISPLKKTFPNNHVPSQKYSRTSPGFNPKSWMDESINRSENIFPFQVLYSVFIFSDEITASFRRFGPLFVDWPHKAESKSYFPPKGKSRSSIISQTLDRVFSRAGRYGPKKKKI
uniref:Cytoplasmic polyadenylation element binding protein 4 n=1 Tax=Astyanax mexicanus TaxID=7994 RepID=A0A8B9GRW5_ASTMX